MLTPGEIAPGEQQAIYASGQNALIQAGTRRRLIQHPAPRRGRDASPATSCKKAKAVDAGTDVVGIGMTLTVVAGFILW